LLTAFFFVVSTSGVGGWQALVFFLSPLHRSENRSLRAWWQAINAKNSIIWPLIFTYAFSGLVPSGILKRTLARDRPSQLDWALPQEGFRLSSFPSGHTTTSVAIGIVLAYVWWNRDRRWSYVALTWAGLVGISRIYRGVHWPSDVVGGIFAGMLSAGLTYFVFKKRLQAAAGLQSNPAQPNPA
jgi:membrane-associated phospholipid phosphatase